MKSPIEVLQLYPEHDGTLSGMLSGRAQRDPERPFLIFQDTMLSWGRFESDAQRAAGALAARGIRKGDRFAIMAPNSHVYVTMFFALARIGAILVPVNPDFGVCEAGYVLKHAEIAAAACTADTLAVARRACEGMVSPPWFMLIDGSASGVPNVLDLYNAAPQAAAPANVGPDDICVILYTSGTTGFPKGVMHSQRNFTMAGEGFVERMHLQPDDRLLCILPLFHINALFYSLGGTLAAGASMVLSPRFSASGFWPLAAKSGATEVNIIAAVGNILARRPRSEFVPGHRLRKVYGAPIPPEAAEVFRKQFGVTALIDGYGMTEIPGACNNPFLGPHKIGSLGKPALHPDRRIPFAELRIVNEEGNDVRDGEVGELLVRTPIAMKGYYRDPEQTAAAFWDGWFITGDLVRRDAEGFYHFVARKKDIIRRRGENIAGAELDRVLGQHPGIAEAAAIAVASDLGEDEILVAVVAKADAKLTASDIGTWCAKHLAPAKVPRFVVFVDSLPHTPTHRVAKFVLRQDPSLLARAMDLQATTDNPAA
jgi:crotonobetaine/carnitine-CoA ligase